MQNIPLVLETPSFEKPEVWGKEVEVLNRLSSSLENGEKLEWDPMVEEIKDIVKEASGGASAKPQKKGKVVSKTTTKKRRKKDTETDDDDGAEDEE